MGNISGIRKGRRLRQVKVSKWFTRRRTKAYRWLETAAAPILRFCKRVHSFRRPATGLCSAGMKSSGIRLGQKSAALPKLPKGHLVVCVGDTEGDTCQFVVPVIHVNHPLFGELLGKAEKVYGFNHPGMIKIPCPKSELEKVQMKIAATSGGGVWRTRLS